MVNHSTIYVMVANQRKDLRVRIFRYCAFRVFFVAEKKSFVGMFFAE
jgi:hypothetical protein